MAGLDYSFVELCQKNKDKKVGKNKNKYAFNMWHLFEDYLYFIFILGS